RPQAKNPAFWLSHLLGGLHFLLGRRDRSPDERASALAGRLEEVPRLLDDARATLVEPVRVFVETALRVIEGGLVLVKEAGGAGGASTAARAGRTWWTGCAPTIRPPAAWWRRTRARSHGRGISWPSGGSRPSPTHRSTSCRRRRSCAPSSRSPPTTAPAPTRATAPAGSM